MPLDINKIIIHPSTETKDRESKFRVLKSRNKTKSEIKSFESYLNEEISKIKSNAMEGHYE